jgi:hypothetical protein
MSDIFGITGPQPGAGKAAIIANQGYGTRYGRHATGSMDNPIDKSWLFEVVDRKTKKVKESFTLIMPPQSYSIKEPQRVSITKTFGNAFIDDYGPDNIQITLKGISGTTHVFPTFSTTGTVSGQGEYNQAITGLNNPSDSSGFTGRGAFYEFRNKIMRYKDAGDWEKYELRVYDLADEQAYRCVLLDFTLDRDSQNPLRYPFTISLFVYESIFKQSSYLKKDVVSIAKDPFAAMRKIDEVMLKLKTAYQDVKSVINSVSLINAKVLELNTRYTRFLAQTTKIITSPLDLSKNLLDTCFIALASLKKTYDAGRLVFDRYASANELFRESLLNAMRLYGYQISQGWQRSNRIDIETDDGLNDDNDARASVLTTYEYTGLIVYTVKGDDTLQSIAQSQLNDSSLWPNIAAVNSDITSNEDIFPGQEIYVPVQTELTEGINKEQFILTEDVARDPYGTDIRLDSDGNIVIQENSDFALVSGIENIKQAIDLRLNTDSGSMIKQTAFGITVQAGMAGTSMSLKYLKMAIQATITQDPRVASLDNLVVRLDRDYIYVSMNIVVVGYDSTLPVTLAI